MFSAVAIFIMLTADFCGILFLWKHVVQEDLFIEKYLLIMVAVIFNILSNSYFVLWKILEFLASEAAETQI